MEILIYIKIFSLLIDALENVFNFKHVFSFNTGSDRQTCLLTYVIVLFRLKILEVVDLGLVNFTKNVVNLGYSNHLHSNVES